MIKYRLHFDIYHPSSCKITIRSSMRFTFPAHKFIYKYYTYRYNSQINQNIRHRKIIGIGNLSKFHEIPANHADHRKNYNSRIQK